MLLSLMTTPPDDLLEHIAARRAAGQPVAQATVIRTRGSALRPVGSQMAVDAGGVGVGSVSAGCIDGAVIAVALEVIADGRARLQEFGIGEEQAREMGLACGGRVQIYVERFGDGDAFDGLLAAHRARRPAALVTRLADGAQALVAGGDRVGPSAGDLPVPQPVMDEIGARLATDRSGTLAVDEGLFVQVYAPAPRLLIVGAVHIAQALAPMAQRVGLAVTLIDPRREFATAERFPGVTLSHDRPDEALARLAPDACTAVVTLTHDPRLDDPALMAALASPAFYIGALGSRRTHAQRLERLRTTGLEARTDRIHAPVGLALGGRAPGEIAAAILAEIIQCRYQSRAGSRARADRTLRIAALILAGGASSRMGGEHKLLRKVDGRPLVRHAVDAALASRCNQVLVVTGCDAAAIEATLDPDLVSIVRNAEYQAGLSTSLRHGLAALSADTAAVVVLLADMPRVTAMHIDRILAAFDPSQPGIVVPTCNGRRGNPVLWPRHRFATLRGLVGDTGARGLLDGYSDEVVTVDIGDDAILADVDTATDLAGLSDR